MSHASPKAYAAPLVLDLGPSRRLGRLLAAAHLAAAASLWLAHVPAIVQIALTAVLAARLARHLPLHARRRHHASVERLVWDAQGMWRLWLRDGRVYQAELLPAAYVQRFLAVLRFRCEDGRTRTAILLPDAVEPETFRRLRVRMTIHTEHS